MLWYLTYEKNLHGNLWSVMSNNHYERLHVMMCKIHVYGPFHLRSLGGVMGTKNEIVGQTLKAIIFFVLRVAWPVICWHIYYNYYNYLISIFMQHSQLNQKMTGDSIGLHYCRWLPMQNYWGISILVIFWFNWECCKKLRHR